MSSISSTSRARSTRRLAGLLAAGALLSLGACAGLAPPAPTSASPQLAADWQRHSTPLINFGAGRQPGTTAWFVPTTLPRGYYRIVSRQGDSAKVIDGYRIEIDGSPAKEVRLLLPFAYGNVEAVDERYVNLTSARAAP